MEDVSAFKPALHASAASTLAAAPNPLSMFPNDDGAADADADAKTATVHCNQSCARVSSSGGARLGRAWRAARRLQAGVDRLCAGQRRAALVARARQEEVNRRLESLKVVVLSRLPVSL
jgi:hypothetical protein